MKIDTRITLISLLVGIGSLIVAIKQCQIAVKQTPIVKFEKPQDPEMLKSSEFLENKVENLITENSGKQTTIEKNEKLLRPISSENHYLQNSDTSLYIFTGTVVDKKSNPIAGIKVAFGNQIVITKFDGTFELNIPKSLKEPKITLSKNGKNYPPYENPSGTTLVFPSN